MGWIDIGVNLTDSSFDKDRDEVIQQALEQGLSQLIITGTTLEESIAAIELCEQYPEQLFCTAGVHPHYAKYHQPQHYTELKDLYTHPQVIAVGECGLDFNRNFSTPEQQEKAFEQQLELAAESKLPLFLHERDAHTRQLEMLKAHRDDICGAVAHCFTGSRKALYNYLDLDLDLYIGITGWICDERRGLALRELVADIPDTRLLIETDAPYLLPRDLRPKPKSRRNLPSYLPHIANTVAGLRQIEPLALQQQLEENCLRLFTRMQANC